MDISLLKQRTANTGLAKLAVQCSAETYMAHGSLVLRNYIRAERRQLLVAANSYETLNNTL